MRSMPGRHLSLSKCWRGGQVMDMLESFVTRDELEQHRPLPLTAAGAATDGDVSQQNSHHGPLILICLLFFCKTILWQMQKHTPLDSPH